MIHEQTKHLNPTTLVEARYVVLMRLPRKKTPWTVWKSQRLTKLDAETITQNLKRTGFDAHVVEVGAVELTLALLNG